MDYILSLSFYRYEGLYFVRPSWHSKSFTKSEATIVSNLTEFHLVSEVLFCLATEHYLRIVSINWILTICARANQYQVIIEIFPQFEILAFIH
jgi:hypothetical protein